MPDLPKSNLQPMQITAYHVEKGPVQMYRVDADAAVTKWPDEWSLEPWPESEANEVAGMVTIPDDWRDLSHPKRRHLAMKLGAPPTVKADEADALIAKEIERRVAEHKANAPMGEPAVGESQPVADARPPRRPFRE